MFVSMVIAYLMRRGVVVTWNRMSIIHKLLLLLKKLLLQESFFLSFLSHLFSHLMTRGTENALHYATKVSNVHISAIPCITLLV